MLGTACKEELSRFTAARQWAAPASQDLIRNKALVFIQLRLLLPILQEEAARGNLNTLSSWQQKAHVQVALTPRRRLLTQRIAEPIGARMDISHV